jgi:hypothetical protein
VQHQDRLHGTIHNLIDGAPVKEPVDQVMVVFHQTEDVDFIADYEIHNPLYGIAFADIMEVQVNGRDGASQSGFPFRFGVPVVAFNNVQYGYSRRSESLGKVSQQRAWWRNPWPR